MTTRRKAPALFFVLMLATAVCSWGLQYKMSLYCPNPTQYNVPAAKLLTEKERPVSTGEIDSARPKFPQPQLSTLLFPILIGMIIVGASFGQLRWIWDTSTSDGSRQQSCTISYSFSPRPPPAAPLPS